MSDAFHIRPVAAADVPGVVSLVRRVLAEFGLTFGDGSETDDALMGLPGSYRDHGGDFWVAVTDDGAAPALLGTIGAFPVHDERTLELRKMYLEPAARGLGLGERLFAEVRAFAVARGAARLVLDTTEQMGRAIAFYERHGFVRDDRFLSGSRCHRGYRLDLR